MTKAKAPLKLVAFDAAKYLKDDHAIAIQQVAAQVHGYWGQDLDRQSFSDAAD